MTRPRLQATLACVVTLGLWHWRGGYIPAALAIAAATLAVLAWLLPAAYAPFSRAFERFGHAILVVFTWFALGLVYFGVLTPLRPTATTYLRPLPQKPQNFTRQF
jgi:hypothetical protein